MKYLNDAGLTAYDAKIKNWVYSTQIELPMTLIENTMNYQVGQDVTDQLSYDDLLNICNKCVNHSAVVVATNHNGANQIILGYLICYAASNNESNSIISFWFEVIVHTSGIVYLVTCDYDGDTSAHTVTVGEISIKTL